MNHYYFYCIDEDFGPFFLKFCSYFPYNAKLCLNGHEYLKQQPEQKGIAYQALENGILSCQDPQALQALCDRLSEDKIDALLRKWLRRLPHPFALQDRQAGYRYQLSIQVELALTQVLDRPVSGRIFFEDVIRENLDIGRSKQVQLIFDRLVTRSTPGPFRTRVITDGVIPSLHIDYKGTRIKQYHKAGQALRTETTINNTYDFYIGKNLRNLPALRRIGFQANRRLLQVQRISHDCILAEEAFQKINRPVQVTSQRASALRFADPKVQALWRALLLFQLLPTGFSSRHLRQHFASWLGQPPDSLTQGQNDLSPACASTGSSNAFLKLTAIALPTSAYAPRGCAPEPTAAFSALDWDPYCPSSPHPTPRYGAASTNLIRRSHLGSNTKHPTLTTRFCLTC